VPPSTKEATPRPVLIRRAGLVMIAIGGVFIIFGWGIKAEEWARAVGWVLTGLGFACEMIYGQLNKARKTDAQAEAEKPRASDETSP
jgi:hypothetical protein